MYKFEINQWDIKIPNQEGKIVEHKESLLDALKYLLNKSDNKEGFENFMIMHNLAESFNKVDAGDKLLQLQKKEYEFLTNLVKTKIPSQWAMNTNLATQITKFLEIKEE